MISFAYRYKYEDDEYSALSQFTDIAFVPGVFKLDIATNLNSGMKNIYNAVELSFNTGDSNVVGVDLIKFADSNVLNVMRKIYKSKLWDGQITHFKHKHLVIVKYILFFQKVNY